MKWEAPVNTYVEVNGTDVQVPYPDGLIQANLVDDESLFEGWLFCLTEDELVAGFKFFYDRWNWDSGHPLDERLFRIFALEIKRRDLLEEKIMNVPGNAEFFEKLARLQDSLAEDIGNDRED